MGTKRAKVKQGDQVRHPRLGEGTIIRIGKYFWLVDFSNKDGVLVRGGRPEELELIDGQKTK